MPLDLRRTLRPLGGLILDDGWWRTALTPDGAGTLRLRREDGEVAAMAWGPGGGWLLDRTPAMIGLGDSPDDLVTDHPVVGEAARRHRGMRFGSTGLVFEALVAAIVTQKVTGKEAARSLRGLRQRFSDPAPGPRPLLLPPDPARLAATPYWEFHTIGIEKRRTDFLTAVAAHQIRIDALAEVGSEDAQVALRRYRGIGIWSVAETVAVSHGDADAVSVGDYHHKNIVAWHMTGHPRGTDEEMLATLEPFSPHRGRVVRLLETLGHAPAFGPRMPLRNIESI